MSSAEETKSLFRRELEAGEPTAETCAVCGGSTSFVGTLRAAGLDVESLDDVDAQNPVDRWIAYPAVITEAGETGHVRCLLESGKISIGDRTGKKFVHELDIVAKMNARAIRASNAKKG